TALCFSLLPLGRAARIPGAALFRDALLPQRVRPAPWLLVVTACFGGALVGLTIATAADRGFALWFCAGALGTLALFRLGGFALVRLARLAPRASAPWVRLGLANLHRPGTAAPMLLVSVGLGLSTLAAVVLIQGNLRHQIAEQMPADAPSFYFIDIQDSQLPRFDADRKSTRLNSSHGSISYAVFCLKKKKKRGSQSANRKKNKMKKDKA